MRIEDMTIFKPLTDDPRTIPDRRGIYIMTANNIECLPDLIKDAVYNFCEDRPIIYVGISKQGIRTRDYRCHFNGTARRSTLRKSIGVLMGLHKEYEILNPSKYKFIDNDEYLLSAWMKENLWLHYCEYEEIEELGELWELGELEILLINTLSPPLNIKSNHTEVNLLIRQQLRNLR